MRCLKKNQQKLWYSTYADQIKIYERDENGEIVYADEEKTIPTILNERAGYNNPVSFYANIAMSGGEAETKEYGLSSADYEAVIVTTDKTLPIDELSLIWQKTTPVINSDGTVDGDSADYRVIAVRPSLNIIRYFLKENQKGGI